MREVIVDGGWGNHTDYYFVRIIIYLLRIVLFLYAEKIWDSIARNITAEL